MMQIQRTGWDRDDRVCDLLSKVGLGGLLHLDQDHGRNFLWRLARRGREIS